MTTGETAGEQTGTRPDGRAEAARPVHAYRARLRWSGSTGVGYDAYDRTHQATTEPATVPLTLSADTAFRGDASHLDPEQLLVLSAASCQLLSFLAVAARARIDVVAYRDEATAELVERHPRPSRVERIVLRPHITVRVPAGGREPTPERLARLVTVAHRECYIANSLREAPLVEPSFDIDRAG